MSFSSFLLFLYPLGADSANLPVIPGPPDGRQFHADPAGHFRYLKKMADLAVLAGLERRKGLSWYW